MFYYLTISAFSRGVSLALGMSLFFPYSATPISMFSSSTLIREDSASLHHSAQLIKAQYLYSKETAKPIKMEEFKNQKGTTLHSLGGRTIIRYKNDLVVKPGDLRSREIQTLQFIAVQTTISVRKVHDIHCDDGKVVAIAMD